MGKEVIFLKRLEDVVDYLKEQIRSGDLVLTIGAGNVWTVGTKSCRSHGDGGCSMSWSSLAKELQTDVAGEVLAGVPMKQYTTWRIGGPADLLLIPKTEEDVLAALEFCRQHSLPLVAHWQRLQPVGTRRGNQGPGAEDWRQFAGHSAGGQ